MLCSKQGPVISQSLVHLLTTIRKKISPTVRGAVDPGLRSLIWPTYSNVNFLEIHLIIQASTHLSVMGYLKQLDLSSQFFYLSVFGQLEELSYLDPLKTNEQLMAKMTN